MRLICNRTQNDAIWVVIALFLTNQIAGNTIDFKIDVIKNDTDGISHSFESHFHTGHFCLNFSQYVGSNFPADLL